MRGTFVKIILASGIAAIEARTFFYSNNLDVTRQIHEGVYSIGYIKQSYD